MESSLNIQKIVKPSFAVIGIEGSTDDGEGFIPMLWSDANAHFDEVSPVASRDENGALLGIWGLAVPADLILHERNALALDGVCKDGLGLAGHGRLGECGLDGVKIVAVGQLDEVKAERAELGGQIAKAHDLVVRAVDL